MLPVELIRRQDHIAIVDWALALTPVERSSMLDALQKMDAGQDIFAGVDAMNALMLAKIACARNLSELKRFPASWPTTHTVLHSLLTSRYAAAHEALVHFFTHVPPDYLEQVVREALHRPEIGMDFRLLWRFWQHGWVSFDEALFTSALFYVPMFNRSVGDELDFLRQNPLVIEKVLLTFCQHDVPVLLLSKWQKGDGRNHGGIVTEFWDEVFAQLYTENRLARHLISDLLASLTLDFKKGRLDWHIQLIKMFNPSDEEWLAYQDLLLAALYTASSTVFNFVVQTLQKISGYPGFDHAAFMQSLPALTGREKCDKSILAVLNIASVLAERFTDYRPALAQDVSGALIQNNEAVQQCAAQLMLKYTSAAELAPLVEPYRSGLKRRVADLLQIAASPVAEVCIPTLDYSPVIALESWDALLFHCGTMLAGKEALDIELFYAGVIALQDAIPVDFKKQMQPYYKKLMKPYLGSTLLYTLRDFVHQWLTGEPAPEPQKHERRFPHLQNQNRLVLERLQNRCVLPLLATPTHRPFYVSPQALVERLLAYEQCDYPVDLDDLIIACNRILLGDIAAEAKQQALMLEGDYSGAVRYLLGMSDAIAPVNDQQLPLWTQITRTRDANGVYPQYTSVAKEQASWETVVAPFYCSYNILIDGSDAWTWYRLAINERVRYNRGERAPNPYPERYYYISLNRDNCCSMTDFLYCLSLVPHYADALLQYAIPDTASGNEVAETEDCLYPLKYLLENQLRVHHGGWIYIAVCLLFEKKTSRSLAAEYIQLALQQNFLEGTYLSQCLAYLLMHKFAPVNRFIEYLDNYNDDSAVRAFQKQILAACIESAGSENLPINYKKLMAYYNELNEQGGG
jgi:hypothetical protein